MPKRIYQYTHASQPDLVMWIAADNQKQADTYAEREGWMAEFSDTQIFTEGHHMFTEQELRDGGVDVIVGSLP